MIPVFLLYIHNNLQGVFSHKLKAIDYLKNYHMKEYTFGNYSIVMKRLNPTGEVNGWQEWKPILDNWE